MRQCALRVQDAEFMANQACAWREMSFIPVFLPAICASSNHHPAPPL